jgi:serine/threonine protein phosphatase PrpC
MAFTRQLGSGEDYAVCGVSSDGLYKYLGVMDGHGSGPHRGTCIQVLRSLNFDEIACSPDPVQRPVESLQQLNTANSGSTFTFARVKTETREIEVFNIGDSTTVVMVNGAIVYKTEKHNFQNKEEILRTKLLMHQIKRQWAPSATSDTEMGIAISNVGVFLNGESLVPSQSLGHNNITQLAPSKHTITFNETDRVRILCGSDGFWDMFMEHYPTLFTANPEELMDTAETRWKQHWLYNDGKNPVSLQRFPSADDIGLAVLDI